MDDINLLDLHGAGVSSRADKVDGGHSTLLAVGSGIGGYSTNYYNTALKSVAVIDNSQIYPFHIRG